jgi:D-alanyl-D-alanine dipeptidase
VSPQRAAAQDGAASPIPSTSGQLIVVVSASFEANHGVLQSFERAPGDPRWTPVDEPARVTLGRNGLGLGAGLHRIEADGMPVKREGDGKSPAGVFRLSSAFGYGPGERIGDLAIPYTQITERLECVDDVNSAWYNRIVLRDEADPVDWSSSERMLMDGIWYEKGIVVDHNADPVRSGAGSCIFLHNWSGPTDTTAGCTAMAPEVLTRIVRWLDAARDPVLVQLTETLYEKFTQEWSLPAMPDISD